MSHGADSDAWQQSGADADMRRGAVGQCGRDDGVGDLHIRVAQCGRDQLLERLRILTGGICSFSVASRI